MAIITLQVLEGMERGRTFSDLATPVTIGREDENSIRLNDERVSRFHAKIQEDGSSIILTDLESTNGTRVNGHPVQMRVLQIGDLLLIGRCLLVYGSAEEIARLHASLSAADSEDAGQALSHSAGTDLGRAGRPKVTRAEESFDDEEIPLFPQGPPPLPETLFPVQRAQVSDVLAYLHDQLRSVLEAAGEKSPGANLPAA
ncbi:MAG: FHA domain-containing protein, partial [Planctomycetaceae bacterium]